MRRNFGVSPAFHRGGEMAAALAHVLVFSYPLQGNIGCMLKLAELLSLASLHVTFLNNHHNSRLLARNSGAYSSRLARRPTFRFHSLNDGFDDGGVRSASRLLDLISAMRTHSAGSYRDLLVDLARGAGGEEWPALTCVVADGIMSFAADVADELGIPVILFRAVSACAIWSYLCIPKLLGNGELPFPENADIDEPKRSRGVPGMERLLCRRDLSSFLRDARDSGYRELQLASAAAATADLEKATRERGCLVEWAPQEEVLRHPAVGCFLTHSGWNSTMENMVAGVPMLCCPYLEDQQINSSFTREVWRIGVDLKDVHERTVERRVREVMVGGERAEELRRSEAEKTAMAWRSVSCEGGSSFNQFEKLVQEIRSPCSSMAVVPPVAN